MIEDEIPLLNLFENLKNAGLPLGVGEYQLVIQALRGGFGLSDREALSRLCCALWVKSPDEARIFEHHFNQFFPVSSSAESTKSEVSTSDASSQKYISQITRANQNQRALSKQRILRLGFLLIAALVSVVVGRNILLNQTPKVSPPQTQINISESIPTPQSSEEIPELSMLEKLITLALILGVLSVPYIVFLSIVFVIDHMGAKERARRQTYDEEDLPDFLPTVPEVTLSSKLIRELPDEIQIAKTMQNLRSKNTGLANASLNYLPATQRQMKQSWRHLRHYVREGVAAELDLEETIKKIGRQGIYAQPVLQPCQINRIELLLLVDRDGSMVPFHIFSDRFIEAAKQGGRLGKVHVYYFHNYPNKYLYSDQSHQNAILIEDALESFNSGNVVLLILSDGGASRGGFNPRRRRRTKRFINQIEPRVRNVAWLNPIPKSRWNLTTAEAISEFVPMFEINRQGIDAAIDTLRGN